MLMSLISACSPNPASQTAEVTKATQETQNPTVISDHKTQQRIKDTPAIVNDDTVILSKSHISSVKTERYQPSLTLTGTITHDEQTKQLTLTSTLPIHLQPHINIGDAVRFYHQEDVFGGQVSHVAVNADDAGVLDVSILLAQDDDNERLLGQTLNGRIQLGQMSVGALLPEFAIFDDDLEPLDLSDLHTPPHKPKIPIPAWAWVIKQDRTLSSSPIYIMQYLPKTQRYLVSGISDDSLVVLTPLPKHAQGKQVDLD